MAPAKVLILHGYAQNATIMSKRLAAIRKACGKAPHPPLKFCVVVAGFVPPNGRWARFVLSSYSTPTLHIVGLTDPIVSQEQAQTLVDVSKSEHSQIEQHEGGHFVPSKAPWVNFFKAYFKDPLGNVELPPG